MFKHVNLGSALCHRFGVLSPDGWDLRPDESGAGYLTQWTRYRPWPSDDDLSEWVAEYEAQQYRERRADDYPPLGDQMDAIFKGGAAFEEMRARVLAVKAEYPKP